MYEQPYNPFHNNLAIVKDYFKSRSVLALAILSFASVVITVVNTIVSADLTKQIFSGFVSYYDSYVVAGKGNTLTEISSALHEMLKHFDVLLWSGSIPVLAILTAVGILLVFLKSRNEKPDSSPSAGLTILYVLAILALIGAILAALAMLAVIAAMFVLYAQMKGTAKLDFNIRFPSNPSVRFDSTVMLILAIVTAVVCAVVIFVMLFVAINRVRYIGSIRQSIHSVELSRSGAKPYGVFCVIAAVSSGFSLLSSFTSLFAGNKETFKELNIVITADTTLPAIMSIIGAAVSFAIVIFRAKIALGYAKYIDGMKFGYNQPYAQEAPAPAPFVPSNVGVGSSNTHENPYSYLAQPKATEKDTTSFTNPYLSKEKTDAPAEKNRFCPNCGAKADGNSPFCGQCGAKL